MGWIESMVTSGGDTGPSNRITLLRYGDDGKPQTRTVFLDHLHSPFGVALVGSDLYVASTDAIMRYQYKTDDTAISDAGAGGRALAQRGRIGRTAYAETVRSE